jgi:hypothetical protein
MTRDQVEALRPSWQEGAIDVGRRRLLIGLSAAAMGFGTAVRGWAQSARNCVLTPQAGEGP